MGVLRPQPARGAGVSAGGARRRGRGRPRLADKGGKRKGCAEAMRTQGFVGPVRVAALSKLPLRPGVVEDDHLPPLKIIYILSNSVALATALT